MANQDAQRAFTGTTGSRSVVFNIGEVLSQCKDEFPAVTASKIRFFEEKGLLTPKRTAAGYRQFSPQDVARLRFVLALQRDNYLPLKVIKDYLDAIDRGEGPENVPPGVSAGITPRVVDSSVNAEQAGRARKLTAEQLRIESGASVHLLESLLSFGLIAPIGGRFDDTALKTVKACTALAAHGIEARHLRLFQVAARREFDLVEQAVRPLSSRRDGAAPARAAESAREISDLCLSLHESLVQSMIDQLED